MSIRGAFCYTNRAMPHEFDGDKYQLASSHQKEWGNKIIAEFALKGNEQILDIGCGDGILTEQLATMVPEGYVLGIDASKSMIETAKKLSRNNLSFQIKDINRLDYESRFDLVFSNATALGKKPQPIAQERLPEPPGKRIPSP